MGSSFTGEQGRQINSKERPTRTRCEHSDSPFNGEKKRVSVPSPADASVPLLLTLRLVLDLLRSIRISQRGQRLVVVIRRGRHGAQHDGLGVSSERVLEQSRQLAVAVGDVHLALALAGGDNQRADHVTKRGERQVDLLRFLQTIACRLCLALTLRSGQIDCSREKKERKNEEVSVSLPAHKIAQQR